MKRCCQWCRCSIEDKRPNARTCDDACRKAKSRGQASPTKCHCDALLEAGREGRYRFACSDKCLSSLEPVTRTRAPKPDPYLVDPPRLGVLQCQCYPQPAALLDANGFVTCSACGKRRGDSRRPVDEEPKWIAEIGGPFGWRALPLDEDAAPLHEMSGLTTRTVNGRHRELPKEIRQCAACGEILTFRKRGPCCASCDADVAEAA
jgi:hypothetical protein